MGEKEREIHNIHRNKPNNLVPIRLARVTDEIRECYPYVSLPYPFFTYASGTGAAKYVVRFYQGKVNLTWLSQAKLVIVNLPAAAATAKADYASSFVFSSGFKLSKLILETTEWIFRLVDCEFERSCVACYE